VSIIDGEVLRATYGRSAIETTLVNIDRYRSIAMPLSAVTAESPDLAELRSSPS
jgi:hypothetical protein